MAGIDSPDTKPWQQTVSGTQLVNTSQPSGVSSVVSPVQIQISKAELDKHYYAIKDANKLGQALIFSNEEFSKEMNLSKREGTEVDVWALKSRFEELNIIYKVYRNTSTTDMKNILGKAAEAEYEQDSCFICVIMTHGIDDSIFTFDGKIKVDDILEMFTANNAPSLVMKPKLFFLQACRGDQMDRGVAVTVTDSVPDPTEYNQFVANMDPEMTIKVPSDADFLVACASRAGLYCWKNNKKGSWFIQALSWALEIYGSKEDLLSLLTRVNWKVAFDYESQTGYQQNNGMKQMPSFTSRLTKTLYFDAVAAQNWQTFLST